MQSNSDANAMKRNQGHHDNRHLTFQAQNDHETPIETSGTLLGLASNIFQRGSLLNIFDHKIYNHFPLNYLLFPTTPMYFKQGQESYYRYLMPSDYHNYHQPNDIVEKEMAIKEHLDIDAETASNSALFQGMYFLS